MHSRRLCAAGALRIGAVVGAALMRVTLRSDRIPHPAVDPAVRAGQQSFEAWPPGRGALFERDARRIIRVLKAGSADALSEHLSDGKVLLVKRWMQWPHQHAPIDDRESVLSDTLAMRDPRGVADIWVPPGDCPVWVEKHVSRSREWLTSPDGVATIRMFSEYVEPCLQFSAHYSLGPSLDHWGHWCPGARAWGEVCSNTQWDAYFEDDGDQWRLRELRVSMH